MSKTWMTDGVHQRLIEEVEQAEYVAKGWHIGTAKIYINTPKAEVDEFLDRVDLEQVLHMYKTVPTEDILNKYNITSDLFRIVIKRLGWRRTRQEQNAIKSITEKRNYQNMTLSEKQAFRDAQKAGVIEKYGVENIGQVPEIREKIKQSFLEKYGRNYGFNHEKIKQTVLNRYNVTNVSQLTEVKKKKRQKSIEKYGTDCVLQAPEIKTKIEQTCLSRYGVHNPMQDPEIAARCINSTLTSHGGVHPLSQFTKGFSHQCNSSINVNFEKRLKDLAIEYEREYRIGRRYYDFKINDVLVELNPTPTHNVDWNPWTKMGLCADYHYEKSRLAETLGMHCIHIWDWDNIDEILAFLNPKNKWEITVRIDYIRVSCQSYIREIRLKENTIYLTSVLDNLLLPTHFMQFKTLNNLPTLLIKSDYSKCYLHNKGKYIAPKAHHIDLGYGLEVDVIDCGYFLDQI